MLLGRVLGSVVATIKSSGLSGVRFLLVQPLDDALRPKGGAVVAADATHAAAPGQLIHYEGGREAALALDPWFVPIDHAIVGLVDHLDIPAAASPSRPGEAGGPPASRRRK